MRAIEKAWYEGAWWLYLLLPVSWLFSLLSAWRRRLLLRRAEGVHFSVPVVVVGNLTVGGTGKTPLIIALTSALQQSGLRVGVVSRGYGASHQGFPLQINAQHSATEAGDEPLLIHRVTGSPVVIDADRCRACTYLLEHNQVDVILSDDGLQHYAMPRDMEVAVVDGSRMLGNGRRLPAGPLRESVSRLGSVDAVLVNAGTEADSSVAGVSQMAAGTPVFVMRLQPRALHNLKTEEERPFSGAPFKMGDRVQAVAGIGNPQRFFRLVDQLPYATEHFAFPDHHPYQEADFAAANIELSRPIVMTEKDGIKCQSFANENFWVLHIEVDLPDEFVALITEHIAKRREDIAANAVVKAASAAGPESQA